MKHIKLFEEFLCEKKNEFTPADLEVGYLVYWRADNDAYLNTKKHPILGMYKGRIDAITEKAILIYSFWIPKSIIEVLNIYTPIIPPDAKDPTIYPTTPRCDIYIPAWFVRKTAGERNSLWDREYKYFKG
jgi:hypothetical protein